ncbi:MAG: ATP-grasp domain-containing protein [Candidatus Pacebacteria bacterium]|nr:ATP-grasp domain-containing protein [Candidatus Paceibacterota bacterium]MCD8528148.1 ATP-grasp domain-containing protein [Candidatus Paceibacterota bacterium]MCD8563656.1 ATP-grasp domain-containing protein [Candidatus Paceibacterota bacterium]
MPRTKALAQELPFIFFIGKVASPEKVLAQLRSHTEGARYRYGILYHKKSLTDHEQARYNEFFDVALEANFNNPISIAQTLAPYYDDIVGVTCRSEAKIPDFAKIVPYFPYLKTPTSESLMWSVDKVKMRRRFHAYNPKITPRYKIAKDATKKTLDEIEQKVGFPLVIKPSGLAQSLLVTICYHQEELETNLKKVFRKIKSLHKNYKDADDLPEVIVEQFVDGDMYSIDGYVNAKGKIYWCPPVHITTGKSIGFDDFFGYQQITPTTLTPSSIDELKETTLDGVHALGLRSSTFHAELIKNNKGWKIVEIGPRVGGFRDTMYHLSYGIHHGLNDVLIRIPKTPILPKKTLGHTAVLKFFAPKEGIITTLTGIKKARELDSFYHIDVNKKVGDRASFAKNGGKSVFNITFHNKDRSKLLADIRRLEKMIKIETKKTTKK